MQDEIARLNATQFSLELELMTLQSKISHIPTQEQMELLQTNQSAVVSIVANLQTDVMQQQEQAENFTHALQSVCAYSHTLTPLCVGTIDNGIWLCKIKTFYTLDFET